MPSRRKIELDPADDPGMLASYGTNVDSLKSAMIQGERAAHMVPSLVERIIRSGAWRKRIDRAAGHAVGYAPNEFEAFITEPHPDGIETTVENMLLYLGDQGSEARVLFHQELNKSIKPGGANNPKGLGGKSDKRIVNTHIVSIDNPGPTTRGTLTGNSVGYAIRALESEPELLEQVKAGALSANAAMVKAGLRPKMINLPLEPVRAARLILKHFQGESLETLIRELSSRGNSN